MQPISSGRGFRIAAVTLNWLSAVSAIVVEPFAFVLAGIAYTDGGSGSTWWLIYCLSWTMTPPLLAACIGIVPSIVLLRRHAYKAAFLAALVPLLIASGLALLAVASSGRHGRGTH